MNSCFRTLSFRHSSCYQLQLAFQLSHRRIAVLRLDLQAFEHDHFQLFGEYFAWHYISEAGSELRTLQMDRRNVIFSPERWASCQRFKHHYADRIDVASLICRSTGALLGAHVERAADNLACPGNSLGVFSQFRDAEVQYFHMILVGLVGYHHIVRFEVSMEYAGCVRVAHRIHDL